MLADRIASDRHAMSGSATRFGIPNCVAIFFAPWFLFLYLSGSSVLLVSVLVPALVLALGEIRIERKWYNMVCRYTGKCAWVACVLVSFIYLFIPRPTKPARARPHFDCS